jgi:hypothetical protein
MSDNAFPAGQGNTQFRRSRARCNQGRGPGGFRLRAPADRVSPPGRRKRKGDRMLALWLEYLFMLVAMLSLIGAAYYWWLASRIELPAADAGAGQAMLRLADVVKRAAGLSALGAMLVVASYLMGVFADYQ